MTDQLEERRKAKREKRIDEIAATWVQGDQHKAAQMFVQLLLEKPSPPEEARR